MKSLILIFFFVSVQSLGSKDWTYSIESITSKISHPELMEINLRPKRIERGKYGMSGQLIFNEPLEDTLLIEVKSYRSERGNSDYKLLPFKISESGFFKFMEDVYVKMGVMESFKDCSNMVQIDGKKWTNAFPAGTYELKECLVKTDTFPDHLQPGYYKVILAGRKADFEMSIEIVAKVETSF